MLKAMSDYLAAQTAISFGYDTNLEVVTDDHQKFLLASSGTMDLNRPDKFRATPAWRVRQCRNGVRRQDADAARQGRQSLHRRSRSPARSTIWSTSLRDKYHRPVPGADLLLSNVYDELMRDVTDVKDLGSGVIGGTECDHLAFRTKEVDWQIWIAQGEKPYPCRYVITSNDGRPGPAIQHPDQRLEDRRRRCRGRFRLQGAGRRQADRPQGTRRHR